MTTPIIIEVYDPLWPQHFESLRSRLGPELGPTAASIEHVGSTSVPGLAAKPIIDIDILLRSDADLPAVIDKLRCLGYEHRGDLGVPGREAFRPPPGDFAHHLYVCSPDSREFDRHIVFRNYLRTHPEDANAYAILKRTLAERYRFDREAYNDAKSEFVEGILRHVPAATTEHSRPNRRIIL